MRIFKVDPNLALIKNSKVLIDWKSEWNIKEQYMDESLVSNLIMFAFWGRSTTPIFLFTNLIVSFPNRWSGRLQLIREGLTIRN